MNYDGHYDSEAGTVARAIEEARANAGQGAARPNALMPPTVITPANIPANTASNSEQLSAAQSLPIYDAPNYAAQAERSPQAYTQGNQQVNIQGMEIAPPPDDHPAIEIAMPDELPAR